MIKIKHGFTLAEVLITVAIFGVILTLTLPTLLDPNSEDREQYLRDKMQTIENIKKECYNQSSNSQEYNFCIQKQRYLRLGENE